MAQNLPPDAGPDGAPVPPGPVTPDWVTDEDWDRICASVTAADAPDARGGDDWDSWAPGPDEAVPPEWAGIDLKQFAAQAAADAAGYDEVITRLRSAGVGEGYAHQAGAPPVPGTAAGPAAGFGQGRCLDAAAPCTMLSRLADDASGQDRDFTGATDDQLLGVLSARARLEARQAWERLMAVAEFIRRRPEAGCPLEGPGRMPRVWQLSAVGELRAQLHLSPGEASALLDLAHDLVVKLPRTSAALRDGIIGLAQAQWMSWRCAVLTVEEARLAEDLLFGDPDLAGWTLGMFRDRVTQAVIQVNPDAARKRREEWARERRVEVRCEPSGNASLAGRELPPSAVLAASQALTARARQLRRAGVPGGMDELRALAYLEKLGVLDPLSPVPADGTTGDSPSGATGDRPAGESRGPGAGTGESRGPDAGTGEDPDDDSGAPGSRTSGRGPAGPDPGSPPGGFAAKVNLTVPLTTLLGLAERPGALPGFGPIDPALARDLAAAAARHPASTWCLTITGPDGRPLAHGCGRPPPRPAPHRPPPPPAKTSPTRRHRPRRAAAPTRR